MKRYKYTIILIFSLCISATINLIPTALADVLGEYSFHPVKQITTDKDKQGEILEEESLSTDINDHQELICDTTVSNEISVSKNAAGDILNYVSVDPDFTDVLFIGDSRTVGLSEYGDLRNAEVFAISGMSVFNLFDTKVNVTDGSKKNLEEVLNEKQFQNIYLMLGINELGYNSQKTVTQYQSVVDKIRMWQPDAKIVLEANLHVTQEKSEKSEVYNNQKIDYLNNEIKKIAEKSNCYYIDVNTIFNDENGNLNSIYSNDGSHVLGKYYSVWVEWLRGEYTKEE